MTGLLKPQLQTSAVMRWLADRFELSRGGQAHNLGAMEGLRGFAVFLVFLTHYVTLIGPWIKGNVAVAGVAHAAHAVGNAGVDLFFVLSGYLIYGTLISKPRGYGAFIGRRAQRIYPAFLAVLAIYLVLSFVYPAESRLPPQGWQAAAFLLANVLLLPGLFPIEPVITVAWSLSYEMAYYLAIPLVIELLGLRHRSRTVRVLVFGLAAALITVVCGSLGGPIRLVMFIAGILLFEAQQSRAVATPGSLAGFVALAAGLTMIWLPPALLPTSGVASIALKMDVLFACFFVLCLACFGAPASLIARCFSWRPLRWLGNMSYSYYLLHGLTLKAAFMALHAVWPPAAVGAAGSALFCGLLPAMFVVSLLPAAVLFVTIERPLSLKPAGRHQNTAAVPPALHQGLRR